MLKSKKQISLTDKGIGRKKAKAEEKGGYYSTTRPLRPPSRPHAPCSPVLLLVLWLIRTSDSHPHTHKLKPHRQTHMYNQAQSEAP